MSKNFVKRFKKHELFDRYNGMFIGEIEEVQEDEVELILEIEILGKFNINWTRAAHLNVNPMSLIDVAEDAP